MPDDVTIHTDDGKLLAEIEPTKENALATILMVSDMAMHSAQWSKSERTTMQGTLLACLVTLGFSAGELHQAVDVMDRLKVEMLAKFDAAPRR